MICVYYMTCNVYTLILSIEISIFEYLIYLIILTKICIEQYSCRHIHNIYYAYKQVYKCEYIKC